MPAAIPEMAGEILLVTGTGKYMKNINDNPEENLGIVRVSRDGKYCELLWGFTDGGTFTSEITMHLSAHHQRRLIDKNQCVVMHAHPANVIAMTHTCILRCKAAVGHRTSGRSAPQFASYT